MKLKTKIVIPFVLVSITLLITISAFFVYFVSRATISDVHQRLESTAKENAYHIENYLSMLKWRIVDFSSDGEIKKCLHDLNNKTKNGCGVDDLSLHFSENKLPIFEDLFEVFVVGIDGHVAASSDKSQVGKNKINDPYFVYGKEKPYLKKIYHSQTLDQYTTTISAPVIFDDKLEGVIVGRLKLKNLSGIISKEENANILIVDDQGGLITPFAGNPLFITRQIIRTDNTDKCVKYYREQDLAEEIKKHNIEDEILIFDNHLGDTVLGAHAYVPEMNWCVLAEVKKSDAFTDLYTMLKHYLLSGILTIIVLFFCINWIAQKITRSIRTLHEGVNIIRKGNLNHRVGTGNTDEIGELSRVFDEMTDSIKNSQKETQEKLKAQEHLLGEKIQDLEQMNDLMTGRELKMLELKKEILELKKQMRKLQK